MISKRPVFYVNGKSQDVDPSDRGLAYGDGLFETMAVRDGRIRWLDHHLDRLLADSTRLGIVAPARGDIEHEILARLPESGRAVAKLIITRGPGARGYAPPAQARPTRILSVGPWPDYPDEHYTRGIAVTLAKMRLGENPMLAGIKHLCRLEQVLARSALVGGPYMESIMLSQSGHVAGATMSNVFAVHGRKLLTPSTDRCGVHGVMRRAVMDKASAMGLEVREEYLQLETLLAGDELFVTNAVFGIWPIASFDEHAYAIGPVTQKLMDELEVAA